jgi:protein-L-isoaspartate(D-aspartate) O-methyltransferase
MILNKLLSLALLVWLLAGCASGAPARATATQTDEPGPPDPIPSPDSYLPLRLAMVEETIVNRGVTDEAVLQAVRTVPRHRFVPQQYLEQAYADHPLPIGYGQTISQPYIVAWMTELMDLQPGDRVLEIGTGSGYQAAVLAELGDVEVYTLEIVPELAESAAQRLKELGYTEVHARQGDGYYGWEEAAPFDAIIVTAAPDHLPAPLVAQLAEGGSLVIPIGPPGGFQSLWRFVEEQGELVAYNMGGVAFVPFTGPGIEQAPRP